MFLVWPLLREAVIRKEIDRGDSEIGLREWSLSKNLDA